MSKRVIRILSYEGNPAWVDATLARNYVKGTKYHSPGTIRELYSIEMRDGEDLPMILEDILAEIDLK